MYLCSGCHNARDCDLVHYRILAHKCEGCGRSRECVFCALPTTASAQSPSSNQGKTNG